jgi:ATP-dependent 26S proteasome regulatory subunit
VFITPYHRRIYYWNLLFILAQAAISSAPNKPSSPSRHPFSATMALDTFFHNKIESMKLEIIQGQAVLRRLEAQRNDYNSRVRLLREELGLLQQPGSYVGEVVKVMGTKKVLVKVHPEGKYGRL